MSFSEHSAFEQSISRVIRHDKYYIDQADLHILVRMRPQDGKKTQQTMFRVHSYFFSRESPVFNRRINPASPGNIREGSNDKDPVVLEDVAAEDFEKFLWVFYNPTYSLYDASVGDWNCILELADKWDFDEVKELAVRELHKKKELSIVQRMALYEKYKVNKRHLVPLYAALCQRDYPLTLEETKILGFESTVLVNTARERLRSKPSDEGRSPLPEGLEEADVFRTIEASMGIEEGTTAQYFQEHSHQYEESARAGPSTPTKLNRPAQPKLKSNRK
ncbi:hypothetical protein D9619_002080 [Psilocybe cf. subviscida]|uniref:BTB domain-containing protein n=1 Tax=Psilocybe cf. subviscida TaxID=2480587 RepID=A0A8H5BEU3_9AGAR|nr:hypothetical protein D9619_002080 [Psilocybe cf. subviscida]